MLIRTRHRLFKNLRDACLSNNKTMYILIDIGGTKTRVTFTKHKEAFLPPEVFSTPQNFEEWSNALNELARKLSGGKKIEGVVAGVPGTFSPEGVIFKTPNLPEWKDAPLKKRLEELFSCRAIIENDTALVGLGEAVFGAGKTYFL